MSRQRLLCSAAWRALLAAGMGAALFAAPAEARITSIVITARTSPVYNGATFGSTGAYEQLDGMAYGEVDPKDPLNAIIQDIDRAPRNADGMVAYSMNISILKPVNMSQGNHVLLYDVVNRGNKIVTSFFNTGTSTTNPQGDGFLENQGYTMVWSGWQGDLLPLPSLITLQVPVAQHRDGTPITGIMRDEITPSVAVNTEPLTAGSSSNTPGYPTVSLNTANTVLTERVHQYDPQTIIPPSQYAFADCTTVPFPGTPNAQSVCLGPHGPNNSENGFDTNHIYELLYTAKNPLVLGLGFAATRDFVNFLRTSTDSSNPLAGGGISKAVMHGTSQSGRWERTYLDLGFNEAEDHSRVFEGMNPHIGSVRGSFNIRFGTPGRLAGTEHTEKQYPGPELPQTYQDERDPVTGVTAGLLDRCTASNTCPKIVHVMSDTEYWEASGSGDTTNPEGTKDLVNPSTVRIYQMSSTQHGGYSPVAPLPTSTGICEQLPNVNSYTYILRDLLVRLTDWVVSGEAPPASKYSTISGGTLVRPEQVEFPQIPGVTFNLHTTYNTHQFLYRGPKYDPIDVSGVITEEPPLPLYNYQVLLPQVDLDGNDIGGVRSVTLQAPLGTYTGWNTRRAGYSEGDACDLTGSYIPFAVTDADRAAGDPRPSLQARYGNHAGYVAAVTRAANTLVRQGFLLLQDAQTQIQAAAASSVLQ
ncbi:MAG: hypothetical protein JO264_18640 [Acidisphaera sp.]|nr:hypothetical protein [Acidisphaera sp.]